jgi:hypothetical protein
MKSAVVSACVAVVLSGVLSELASAQFVAPGYVRPQVNPIRRPTLSPYLNLARGGNPAITYYGLVRPQFEAQAQFSQLQQQLADQQALIGAQQNLTTGVPITGRAAGFQTHLGYFQNWRGRSGGTAGTGSGFGLNNTVGAGSGLAGNVGVVAGGFGRTAPRSSGTRSGGATTTPRPSTRPMNPEE